jgi:proton-dependent oligopeptide transporter, POT family
MSAPSAAVPDAVPAGRARRVPRWFVTLFLTDMWERFGFYGLLAILVLYASAPTGDGGLGLSGTDAPALFGAWIAVAFMLSLPGGWVGDRLLGPRQAALLGLCLAAVGYGCLAVPVAALAPLGLVLLAAGTGLYKPNQQAILNSFYATDSGRRESAISLIYVGIQLSALLAPLVTGYLGERVNWHLGFAVAAVALLFAIVQFWRGSRRFGTIGAAPARRLDAEQRAALRRRLLLVLTPLALLLAAGVGTGALSPKTTISVVGLLTVVAPVMAYRALRRNPELDATDRRRLRTFLALLLGTTLFWMLIGQVWSVLSLFARDSTNRIMLGFTVPASWLQSATPFFMLLLGPVLAWALPKAGPRLGVPGKFAVGLLLAGASFLVMSVAATLAADGDKVSPLWLLCVTFMHACGEIIVAAVAIAATIDVLPRPFLGHLLGLFWLFAALGGGLASGVVRLIDVLPDPVYYLALGLSATAAGLAFLVRRAAITRGLAGPADPVPAVQPADQIASVS